MDDLDEFDDELRAHFFALRERRDLTLPGAPIFALEHNLDNELLDLLRSLVRERIAFGRPSSRKALPYVVYATEIGYRYEDEYWPSFEGATPGWIEHGDRHWIRRIFSEFANEFGGARPAGAWGRQFSIISWPITHAVLPTDLQRHLARLLAEYRYRLNPELVEDPDELGVRLEGRAFTTSGRFRVFAQNTSLLGLVAVSLLLGDESDSPLLERSTLDRIVADLSAEEESLRWLKAARESALRLQLRGLSSSSRTSGHSGVHPPTASVRVETPKLRLVAETVGWSVQLEPPDVTPLFDRFAELQGAVANSRPRIAGMSARRPLSRGQLLYLGLPVRIDTWPEAGTPIIQLEGTDEKFNLILADECRTPFDSNCLFRLTSDPVAGQIKGMQIRAAQQYVLVSRVRPTELPAWCHEVDISCDGAFAFELDVPNRFHPGDIESATQLGLGVISELSLRPVGIEPAEWDGAGTGEWLVGEDPIIAVDSTLEAIRCIVVFDETDVVQLPWPPPVGEPLYVRLTDLPLGDHHLQVALVPPGEDPQPVAGDLVFSVREPRARASSGSYREALMLLSSPAAPTIEDLWEGRAALDAIGPPDAPVVVSAVLEDHQRRSLVANRLGVRRLPIENRSWQAALDGSFRHVQEVRDAYDLASSCLIRLSDPEIGLAEMRFERSFVPLRWGMGRRRDDMFLRLHDNTGDDQTIIERFAFDEPDTAVTVASSPDHLYADDRGGLFLARSADEYAAVILPARVRSLEDLQRLGQEHPRVTHRPRTPESLVHWSEQSDLWARADTRGDPIVEKTRNDVLRAFAISVAAVVGKREWGEAEYRAERGGQLPSLDKVVGSNRGSLGLRSSLQAYLCDQEEMSLAERVLRFAAVLSSESIRGVSQPTQVIHLRHQGGGQVVVYGTPGARLATTSVLAGSGLVDQVWVAEFTLRVASAPATATRWAGQDARRAFEILLESPIALRAARLAVLHLARSGLATDGTIPYGGWPWE